MKKIMVAVSGGPDSMALLDMLNKENIYEIHVAHVNYQKRESAYRDEKIVKTYCDRNQLFFYKKRVVFHHEDNFESWAREIRYDFFESICKDKGIEDVYVAHHKDDCIETYIFQKQRNMLCDYYGLKEETTLKSFHVHRPLLSYTKSDLIQYCIDQMIEYGIDETNLSDDYTRNKIRHSIVDSMSLKDKDDMIKEIEIENKKMRDIRKEMNDYFSCWNGNIDLLNKNWMYLEWLLYKYIGKHFSKKYCLSLLEQLHSNCLIDLDSHYLERFNQFIYIEKKKEKVHIVLNEIEYKSFDDFTFAKEGKTIEGITLYPDDFPITIRNVENCDGIQLRFGTKNIHRFFVDRKICKIQRMNWLLVENAHKQVIFVPKIGCDVNHFSIKPNIFMIK